MSLEQVVGSYHHGPHSARMIPEFGAQQIAQKGRRWRRRVFDRFVEQHDPSRGKHRGRAAALLR